MVKANKYKLALGVLLLILPVVLFTVLNAIYPLKVEVSYSKFILDRHGEVLTASLSADDKWRMKTELEEISPTLKKAIVYKEDRFFYYHFGVNPLAVLRALFNNVTKGKRTSGASTISMQVVRLLKPRARNYRNKVIEMFNATQLEMAYSKAEILQLYLNLVPYGGNIEGVKAAAILYFNKAPNHLSLAEITALSLIPNRPTSLRPGKNDAYLEAERNKWLQRFKAGNLFNEQFIEDALAEPFSARLNTIPKLAPHFTRRLINNNANKVNINSTLDLSIQQPLEEIVKNYTRNLQHMDINNAAVLVVDNASAEVLAYIGSSDFYNTIDAGQVDGIAAIRSPGSTLKPFIYANAFDKGIVSPKLKITDLPVDFANYTPSNYSDKYSGLVSIEHALQQSLNIPAVKILNDIGVAEFMKNLSEMNFEQINKDKQKLGLSLALGGCGVRLSELTAMYASFANKGKFRPLIYTKNENVKRIEKQVVSEASAFLTTEILLDLNRPDYNSSTGNVANMHKIAWKTGTSYGRKDAWSIGYNKDYTVGVWTGNFSAKGVPELTGATIATPLLFQVFKQITKNNDVWNYPPETLNHTWVCSETGKIPNHYCDNQVLDFHIPLVTKREKCNHLKTIYVNNDSTTSFCKHCLPPDFKQLDYQNHSAELITFFENTGRPYNKIPKHNASCERFYANETIKITSPKSNVDYYLLKEDNEELLLESHLAADVQQVHWYINDKYFQTTNKYVPAFFKPTPGKNKITCVDDKGRKSSLFIKVNYL